MGSRAVDRPWLCDEVGREVEELPAGIIDGRQKTTPDVGTAIQRGSRAGFAKVRSPRRVAARAGRVQKRPPAAMDMQWTLWRRHRATWAALAVLLALAAAHAGSVGGVWDIGPRASGSISYAVDPTLGSAAVKGARDAFAAWDEANADLVLIETGSWAAADVRVARMDVTCSNGAIVSGCACLSILPLCPYADNLQRGWHCSVPNGATIGVAPGMHDRNGTLVPYTREQMRDLVAHEFGHNLGLVHDAAEGGSHVMSGPDDIALYSDRGYAVPDRIAGGGPTPGMAVSEWAVPESCVQAWGQPPD